MRTASKTSLNVVAVVNAFPHTKLFGGSFGAAVTSSVNARVACSAQVNRHVALSHPAANLRPCAVILVIPMFRITHSAYATDCTRIETAGAAAEATVRVDGLLA